MPEPHRPTDRTAAEREADHAGLARLSETLVPALVQKLTGSGLGELEIREGDWRIRIRRPAASIHARRERARSGSHGPTRPASAPPPPTGRDPHRAVVTSPAVGVFRAVAAAGSTVRAGDRIAVVDLLGIPQDVVAPIDGLLVNVLVETGQAVEFGEEVAIVQELPDADDADDDPDDGADDDGHAAGVAGKPGDGTAAGAAPGERGEA